ncbi:hypothetical protein BCR44DRAFT_34105 [Catenaria anguillulae PL171]|uniref:Uncharacterized protein n=1 Tax=Catenaria anguillulae PL171 TaxID=765915 RepID=A0A1Y2HUK8_9FUNG|nr:hypothetical protein BCR44DRAFT_34105 [Catenaria anguillulae PL171]
MRVWSKLDSKEFACGLPIHRVIRHVCVAFVSKDVDSVARMVKHLPREFRTWEKSAVGLCAIMTR